MQNEIFYDEDGDEDAFEDVDRLFSKLESFEPPEELVQQIMDAVAQMPPLSQLQHQHDGIDQVTWHNQNLPS